MYMHIAAFKLNISRTPYINKVSRLHVLPGHALNADGEVLRHVSGLDGGDAHVLQVGGKLGQLRVVVQLGSVCQAPRPRKDGGWENGDTFN